MIDVYFLIFRIFVTAKDRVRIIQMRRAHFSDKSISVDHNELLNFLRISWPAFSYPISMSFQEATNEAMFELFDVLSAPFFS